MSYARNSNAPRPIMLGVVTNTSNGTVETAGVSGEVRMDSGGWNNASGTLSVNRGVWSYTPTREETNCETLSVTAYKNGCFSAFQQVVFSRSNSFGYAGLDWNQVINQNSTVYLDNTFIRSVNAISGVTFPNNFNTLTSSGIATDLLSRSISNESYPSGQVGWYVKNSDVLTSTRLSSLGAKAPDGWIDSTSITNSAYQTITNVLSNNVGSGLTNLADRATLQTIIGITV